LDREIADERRQDDTLQAYLDEMSQLLTDKELPLHRAHPRDILSSVARARTLTVLPRLDDDHKARVVQFLYESDLINRYRVFLGESGLINKRHPIVSLRRADLYGVNLSGLALRWASLSGAQLSRAYLRRTRLRGADLSGANLGNAKGVTNEQLSAAKSLEGATMPDGQTLKSAANPDGPTFEDWLKSKNREEGGKNDDSS
jgi:hypothetical protein